MTVHIPQDHRIYRQNDPAQCAFRGAVSDLREEELVEVENDLAAFARTGIVSTLLSRLLDGVDMSYGIAA